MSLKIYGSPRSRTMRVLWAIEELDLDYELIPREYDDPRLKQEAFLQLNPAGSIPTIVDGEFVLSESLAINFYLARKYGADGPSSLFPTGDFDLAKTVKWCQWGQAHLEPWIQKDRLPDSVRSAIDTHRMALLNPGFQALNITLSRIPWLAADHFTIADLNLAAILSPSRTGDLDLSPFPKVQDWLSRCYHRPAAIIVRKKYSA